VSIGYRALYLFGVKPWDSGVSPPELKEVVEGPKALTPGRALDLGCGTGTNSIYMAQHGWDVTGIDFVPKALNAAKQKAQAAHASPRLLLGDVTRLGELGVGDGFTLLFDLGCYHSIPEKRRDAYASGVTVAAASGATFLIWGFRPLRNPLLPARMTREEVEARFGADWDLVRVWGGEEPDRFPGGWYRLQRH
jgi:SAM-dependent methyltransferase